MESGDPGLSNESVLVGRKDHEAEEKVVLSVAWPILPDLLLGLLLVLFRLWR